jgi:hypothetical protein
MIDRGTPEYIKNKSTPGGNFTHSGLTDEEAEDQLDAKSEYIDWTYANAEEDESVDVGLIDDVDTKMLAIGALGVVGLVAYKGGVI